MTRKIYIVVALFLSINIYAQTDDMKEKVDASFRMGQSNYKAKPKNAWELGIHAGHFFIDGDVDRTIPGGYGLGLHLRKAIHYAFSVRADLFYGVATGLEPQPYTHSSVSSNGVVGGGLVEKEYIKYADNPQGWFPSHKTTQAYGVLQGIINIGNILFHKPNNKWNWYLGVGAGLSSHTTKLDLLNGDGIAYQNLVAATGFSETEFDTKAGRGRIKDKLNAIYDGVYETEGPKKAGIFRLGDETNIHVMFTGSVGVARKINKRFNIGIEHQVMATDNDYLDGIRYLNSVAFTQDVDIEHYTNLRLAINIGKLDATTEPLYWVNPLEASMNDMAELKARPVLDLTDSDADGIIDMMDQEANTPSGASVDTRGVALDSDNDKIPDYKDKEPYSPIGYDINKDGIANVKKCESCLTEADVFRMIDSKAASMKPVVSSDCGKWFLPMIHYDLDKYNVKPEFYGHLHHVATVMKQCPSLCVSVVGHTDVRSSNNYNNVLSYNRAQAAVDYLVSNYGIDKSRLKVMYGGEDAPMVNKGNGSKEHYMNRRVEFRICEPTDADMGKPEGPSAGSGGRGKSGAGGSGSTLKGNKNSGY